MNQKKRICLDCSCWSGLFNREPHQDLQSLEAIIERFDDGKIILVVPAIVSTEVATNSIKIVRDFERFLLRTNIEQVDITTTIAMAAGALRRQIIDAGMKLRTPDAIIVAAANHVGADFILSGDRHIVRMDGSYGIKCKIGSPSTFFDDEQPLLRTQPSQE